MNWAGGIYFGDTWMAFRGRAADNRPHAHAALQLAFSKDERVKIEDPMGNILSGTMLLVKAGEIHTLKPIKKVTLLFIEPQSTLAGEFLSYAENGAVSALNTRLVSRLNFNGALKDLLVSFDARPQNDIETIDPRLSQALDFLRTAPLKGAVTSAALHCGLSESRLRAIAQNHMNVPLSKWLAWQALRRSANALLSGESLAGAAYTGGFSDQAHFTRTMVKIIGITPNQARNALA